MGLFDFFKGKGGETDERAIARHGERVVDKRGMSPDRFASIDFLCKLGTEDAWRALLPRFNFVVDPSITDREEKTYIYDALVANPEHAVEPVSEYLRVAQTLSWPIKMLKAIVSREDLVGELVDFLGTFDTGYEKNAERKVQIIAALEEEPDPRVAEKVIPFLDDFSEDARFHAIRTLVAQGDESARVPLIKLLLSDTSMRIRSTVVEGLAERAWGIEADQKDTVTPIVQSVPNGPWGVTKELKVVRSGR